MTISEHARTGATCVLGGARALLGALVLLCAVSVEAATVLKIATLSPDGSIWMKLLREGGETVASRTDGRVTFKFYPGGVMGDDKAVLRKIRAGQLHGAVLTAGGLNQIYSDLQLYTLPMVFHDLDEVDAVRPQIDPMLMAGLREHGYVGFGIAEVGFAYAMSKDEVLDYEDIRAQKVWIPDGDAGAEQTVRSFDITPIPLSIADVLGGLQTGLIDSVAVPPVGAIALQWHSQLHYVYDLPLLYVYGLLAVEGRHFAKLTPEDQQIVMEAMGSVVERVDAQNREDHERAVEVLKSQGLVWNRPSDAEADRWRTMAEAAADDLVAQGIVSKDLYTELESRLARLRERVD